MMNRSHRRPLFALFSVFLTVVLVLSACSGSNNSSQPPSSSGSSSSGGSQSTGSGSSGAVNGDNNASGGAENFYSDGKPVTLIAPAAPGSGWDLTARSLVQTFEAEKLTDFPVPVVNEPGASGAISLAKLVTQHKGDAYMLSVTSTPIMYNYLREDSKYGYQDVTMIARLMTEYYMVVVPANSPYQTLKDLLDEVAKSPGSVPVGTGGDDRMPFALLVDASGGNPRQINFVAYDGGGEITTALLNGDLKAAISGVSEFRPQVEAGNLRGLAILREERMGGTLADIPTAIEQGIDVTFGNWRGVMGPPEMPEAAVTFWENTIEKALQTQTWKEIAEKNQWDITFMKGEEFKQYLDKVNEDIRKGLQKTGQIQ